ncbi:MAG TPA: LysM peptidoglycan-binding domain-containing protein [Tepidisphaeraceae bacterium]|nr:LysM peptidoglycan-binding domain-containing protein [Tepidisphaeraceae bacterium]
MQGSKTPLIVAAMLGWSLAGCTVHNHPAPPPPPLPQGGQQRQPQQPQAQAAVQNARPAPQPATQQTTPSPAPAPVPTAPKPAPQPAPVGRSYTIKPGDNLWNIAKDVYGDGTKYQRILDANPGLNPDNMKPGTTIVIP